jgi:hypothetical protein
MKTPTHIALSALALAAGSASAANHTWDWNSSTPNPNVARNNGGGTFKSIHTEFDSATNRFLMNIVFSDRVTNGLTLRMGDGTSNPGNKGEQAILYFDAASLASPKLTAYAYNGQSWATSYYDANGASWGAPGGDMIHGTASTSWINSLSATNTANNSRTFTLDINASAINGHTPAYPGPGGAGAWDGLRCGPNLALWINTFDSLATSYTTSGRLNCWDTSYCSGEGWLTACDNTNFVVVPLPPAASVGLAGLGLAAVVVRRRSARAHRD